jgi:ATP-dependent Clp protease protease subunit
MNTIVTETTEHGEIPIDIYQKLSNDRILFICSQIDDKLAVDIAATLILKDSEDSDEKITLFINSNGGDIRNILMIYDVMQMIDAPIETVCIGSAMDESALLLAAGTPGMRLITKNSIVAIGQLIHDWMAFSDMTDAEKILKLSSDDNKKMMEIIAKCCKKPFKTVKEDFERKTFMNANQALKYGLVDKIISFSKK